MEKPKTGRGGSITERHLGPKEREILAQKIKQRHDRLRNRYREIHKKVVDWVSHSVEEGNVYVCIRFMDKTEFSLQFSPQILTDGIELSDMSTGNFKMIR